MPKAKSERPAFYRETTQQILLEKFDIGEIVTRSSAGVPVLRDRHISISHSEKFLAIMLADFPCGIDVQVQNRLLGKGKEWFYNRREREVFGDQPPESTLYRIWCAKEAFYKMKAGEIGDLCRDVSVLQVSGNIAVIVNENLYYTIHIEQHPGFFLAFCHDSSEV